MAKATGKTTSTPNDRFKLAMVVATKTGAAQLNGLRRFPTTLYKDEWLAILDRADSIRNWLNEHDAELKDKTESGTGAKGDEI
jgi:hypothetical protein